METQEGQQFKIIPLPITYDVEAIYKGLRANPQLWNVHKDRTVNIKSPHVHVDDIWCRYIDQSQLPLKDNKQAFQSVWYDSPIVADVKAIADDLVLRLGGTELGGVLITRVPAGKCVRVHNDAGAYHSDTYSKYIVQIRGNQWQGFCFNNDVFRANTGEAYWFDNHHDHAVYNCSGQDRISLIIAIKTPRGIHRP